jgi:hypothetical protein
MPVPLAWPSLGTMGGVRYPELPPLAKTADPRSREAVMNGKERPVPSTTPVDQPPIYQPAHLPKQHGFAIWAGYAYATKAEQQAMDAQTAQHRHLVGPNLQGAPAEAHVKTHKYDPETGDESLVRSLKWKKDATESGQVFLRPKNGRPVSTDNPVDSLYHHPALGPGKNDGVKGGVELNDKHPDSVVISHVHHDVGRRYPAYIRIDSDPESGRSVYYTLRPSLGEDSPLPVSPNRFNSPIPGDTNFPAGPPGPYEKIHPAGADHPLGSFPRIFGPGFHDYLPT